LGWVISGWALCSVIPVAKSRWMARSCRSRAMRSRSRSSVTRSASARPSASSMATAACAANALSASTITDENGRFRIGDLSPGDFYVSVNSHQGRPDVLTAWMDPAVVDENDLLATDPSLDMFDPDHGPPYSEEFIARYRDAQRDRNDRITAWARDELARLREIGISDRMFVVNRLWADLRFLDLSIDPSDRRRGCYWGEPKAANYGSFGIATSCTLRSWLSMWSLETAQCRGGEHLRNIDVPSLVVQSMGDQGVFPSDARAIFESLGAADKTFQLVRGAHYFEGDDSALKDVIEVIAAWTTTHTT